MRVVAGIYKGRTLCSFSGSNIRPTSDMARESLFNIINPIVEGSNFLDLCCGTGAMGIEALSRGAESVCFNDISRDSLKVLQKNLEKIGTPISAKVSNYDAQSFIKRTTEKFDIVYLDPPYCSDVATVCLPLLSDILSDNGIIIYESEQPFTGEIKGLSVYDQRKYGRARLTFFKKG